jgi:hypothetical protein
VGILNANEIAKKAGDAAFGNPLVENSWRSHVVEIIVECVLFPEWKWSAEGWSGWDWLAIGDRTIGRQAIVERNSKAYIST